MSLIAMCVYCTDENNKLPLVKECLGSLVDTVDLEKHELFLINNNISHKETGEWLDIFAIKHGVVLARPSKNIGTAAGINLAIARRGKGEMVIKTDDDLTWGVSGWVEQLEKYCTGDIGILGLKRKDVWQRPDHENPAYRTKMEGKLEICEDIFGTCTAYNPLLLDKIGYLNQPSKYGFDDVLVSVRSIAAGFRNAFLPHVPIENLDLVETEYTRWKRKEAGIYIGDVSEMCRLIKEGKLSYYYGVEDEETD